MLGKHASGVCASPGPAPSPLASGSIFYNAYEFMPQRQPRHPQPLPPSPLKSHLVPILLLQAGSVGANPLKVTCHCVIVPLIYRSRPGSCPSCSATGAGPPRPAQGECTEARLPQKRAECPPTLPPRSGLESLTGPPEQAG